jgi:predicted DNA binding CopG/RHH family protein
MKLATTDAQKKATIKYMAENLEEIRFRVPIGDKEKIRAFAQTKGMSLTAYIKSLIEKDMEETK